MRGLIFCVTTVIEQRTIIRAGYRANVRNEKFWSHRWMGNITYLNFVVNVSQNKHDLSETWQGKMVGFCKHDYEPSDNENLYLRISVDYLLSKTAPNAGPWQNGKLRNVRSVTITSRLLPWLNSVDSRTTCSVSGTKCVLRFPVQCIFQKRFVMTNISLTR
jgi:hypothetical protein